MRCPKFAEISLLRTDRIIKANFKHIYNLSSKIYIYAYVIKLKQKIVKLLSKILIKCLTITPEITYNYIDSKELE